MLVDVAGEGARLSCEFHTRHVGGVYWGWDYHFFWRSAEFSDFEWRPINVTVKVQVLHIIFIYIFYPLINQLQLHSQRFLFHLTGRASEACDLRGLGNYPELRVLLQVSQLFGEFVVVYH